MDQFDACVCVCTVNDLDLSIACLEMRIVFLFGSLNAFKKDETWIERAINDLDGKGEKTNVKMWYMRFAMDKTTN